MAEQCNGCRFWLRDDTTVDPNDDDWSFGPCRRMPPTLSGPMVAAFMPRPEYGNMVDPELDTVRLYTASLFPVTFATDWCGQFERAREEAAPC